MNEPVFSEWIDGKAHCPQSEGWYQVRETSSVPTGGDYAYWRDGAWHKAVGWPADDANRWRVVGGRLVIPKYNGRPMTPSLGLWERDAKIERWRGFL